MRRVLITGGLGQLGMAIHRASAGSSNSYIVASHDEVDICRKESLIRAIEQHDIDTIINCAAYTNVDGAEDDAARAMEINSTAVAALAEICHDRAIRLIHISTDYVFGGDVNRATPYTESDTVAPINIYGRSKAMGESEVMKLGGVVIRTSWLYAPWGKNFVRTIVRLATERAELSVVDDQRGTPTSALGLARMLVTIIDNGAIEQMEGIYHYCDKGETTRHGFAKEIVAQAGVEGCTIATCSTAERSMRAKRPAYSVLNTERIAAIEGVDMVPWQERLKEVITIIKE